MNYIKKENKIGLSGFYVAYWGSTMNEYKGVYGISHLMEHLLCKGFDDLMENFDSEGIHWNAYTSDNKIVFYMTGLDKSIKKWKKTFYERIKNFNITEEQFQNEKKIIIEEYKDKFNKQSDSHLCNLFRKLYNYYDPIGLLEDLQNINLKDCQNFFEIQFKKPTYIVDISKGKNKKLDDYFKSIDYDDRDYKDKNIKFEINENFQYEKGNQYKDKSSIINLSPVIYDDFAYIEFINRMLGGGLKSPIYHEIREVHGLVYYFHCYQAEITNNSIITILETATSNKNVNKVQDLLYQILNNPDKYLTKERFDITKEHFINKFEKENILIHHNGYKFFDNKDFLLENILYTLTYDDVRRVYDKYYNFSNFYKSVDKDEFKDK